MLAKLHRTLSVPIHMFELKTTYCVRAYVRIPMNGREFNYYFILSAGFSAVLWLLYSFVRALLNVTYCFLFAVIIVCSSTPTPATIVEKRMRDVLNMSIKILIFLLLLLLLHMQIPKDTFFGIILFLWNNLNFFLAACLFERMWWQEKVESRKTTNKS